MPRTARPVAETSLASAAALGVRLMVVWLVALSATSWAGKPCPGENCVRVRPQDDILLVSTRRLGCTTDQSRFASEIYAWRYASTSGSVRGQWNRLPLEEFLASIEPTTPTVMFAHGNRVESCEVRPRGLWVYKRLIDQSCDERPIRYIIFSWPAEQMKGPLRDARTKAARTRPAALHMAWLINQTSPEAPIGLIGYSFGARVVSGATHLLAGGSLNGASLCDCQASPLRRLRGVYLAAAFDSDWLGRGRYHGRSMESLESLLIATNRRDPAMRFYSLLNRGKKPQAMGYMGPTCLPREYASRVRLMNVTEPVGHTHDMCEYMAVRGFMANAWRRLTFSDSAPAIVARTAAK